MKHFILILLTVSLLAPNVKATVSFNIQADLLKTSGGVAASQSTLVLLVASTANALFGQVQPGVGTAVNSLLDGTDDRIVFRTDLSGFGVNGVLDASTGGLSLGSVTDWGTGDNLAIYWFPTLTLASATITAGSSYGVYTRASAVDGSNAWITPADPTSNYPLGFYTQDGGELSPGGGAANPAAAGNANLTVIPEPSSLLLAGIAGLGLMVRRRRA